MDPRSLTPPVLCLVTAGTSSPDLHVIREAALAGVDLIHVRERHLDDRTLVALVRETMDAVSGSGARGVVNDRLDVALAAGAAGVHLRGDSMTAADVRTIVPAGFMIGRSIHSVAEAVAAESGGGCDYLVFGTVFESAGKPGRMPAGLEALARVCAAVTLPVLAIGGVTLDNAGRVALAGAAGVAAIGLFGGLDRVGDTVRALRRLFDTCYSQRK